MKIVLILLAVILSIHASFAQEIRFLAGGKYRMTIGFRVDPPWTFQRNVLDFRVLTGDNGQFSSGVEGLQTTLNFTVNHSTTSKQLKIFSLCCGGGTYKVDFFPTKPGSYSFRFQGTILGDNIDELFNCEYVF